MQLIAKSEFCRKRNCPKLFRDKDGEFYIQGYVIADPGKMVSGLPTDETLVRIDASLLRQIKEAGISF